MKLAKYRGQVSQSRVANVYIVLVDAATHSRSWSRAALCYECRGARLRVVVMTRCYFETAFVILKIRLR